MKIAPTIIAATVFALVVAITATNWYVYWWAAVDPSANKCEPVAVMTAVRAGWEIVPNQPDPCFMRRPRIKL